MTRRPETPKNPRNWVFQLREEQEELRTLLAEAQAQLAITKREKRRRTIFDWVFIIVFLSLLVYYLLHGPFWL